MFRNYVMSNKNEELSKNFDRIVKALEMLQSKGILTEVEKVNITQHGFCRNIQFNARGHLYKIEWYSNCSSLYINNDVQIPFDNFEISGTWPNHFKTNLQFCFRDEIVCVLPIEEYEVKSS